MNEVPGPALKLVRCPECGSTNPLLAAITENVIAITGELALDAVLERLVTAARALVGASYGAIVVCRDEDAVTDLVTSGMDDPGFSRLPGGLVARLARLPASHRTTNLHEDPALGDTRDMPEHIRSLLVVPIAAKGHPLGAFLLGNENTWGFSQAHQELIESLAPHAAIAVENARLFERSRELSVIEERNRLARELHDSVTQTLFSFVLSSESALTLLDRDPEAARALIKELQELARSAAQEMRALVFELRPAELEADGLGATLRKHIDVLRRIYDVDISLEVEGSSRLEPRIETQMFRIIQEALSNALKHAQAQSIRVVLATDGRIGATIADDGSGFDPAQEGEAGHFGLSTMSERAHSIGGLLAIDSAPGQGSTVRLEVPDA